MPSNNNSRRIALIAGISLLLMAVVAIFSFGYAHSTLVVAGEGETTVSNLQSNGGLFAAEIIGWIVILILDVIVGWALYVFLAHVNKSLSGLMGAIRVAYAGILGVAIAHLISISGLINGNVTGTIAEQIMGHFQAFENIWSLGLIVFGVHLLLLGILAYRATDIPKVFGILLVIAAVGYIGIHSAKQLLPNHLEAIQNIEMILSLPMAVGEIAFAIWLVIKGGKPKKTESESVEPSTMETSAL